MCVFSGERLCEWPKMFSCFLVGAISLIFGVSADYERISERLDRMRRSLASSSPARRKVMAFPFFELKSPSPRTRGLCPKEGWRCGKFGKCQEHKGTHVCDCGYGMVGLDCDKPFYNPCLIADQSKLDSATFRFGDSKDIFVQCDQNGEFKALKCPPGFYFDANLGSCTQNDFNSGSLTCQHNPCENGGTCVDHGYSYTCSCRPGFKGINCEIRDSYCAGNPCGNGKCHPSPTDYICECPDRVFDKCCCNDVKNLCDQQDYYAHNATSFVQCGAGKTAYLKSCPHGLVWDQSQLTCTRPSEAAQQFESDNFSQPQQIQPPPPTMTTQFDQNDFVFNYPENEFKSSIQSKDEQPHQQDNVYDLIPQISAAFKYNPFSSKLGDGNYQPEFNWENEQINQIPRAANSRRMDEINDFNDFTQNQDWPFEE